VSGSGGHPRLPSPAPDLGSAEKGVREDIGNVVHPVLAYGLDLRRRAQDSEALDLDREQAALKELLLSDHEARRWAEYGGGARGPEPLLGPQHGAAGGVQVRPAWTQEFLGIRYALVCWLDEIMVDSPYRDPWDDRKLETQLYGTNDRAQAFWEQARRAEGRVGSDASEVFFLCVMLGFRGELRGQAEKLQAWVNAMQARIAQGQVAEPSMPAEKEPPINVPPRRGRERLQRMVLIWAAVLLVLLTAGVFMAVTHLLG
jgi:type VI secretion system protein ImpK